MKTFYKKLAVAFFPVLALFQSVEASASSYEGVVAIVNDELITEFDLESRINLALFALGNNINQQMKERITRDVLTEMIIERLKWTCCKKYEQKEPWVSQEEVEEYFVNVAKQRGISPEELENQMRSRGISKEIFLEQIKIDLSWREYIRARYGKNANVSDVELKTLMRDMKDRVNQPSYYVLKMFFPVNNQNEQKKVEERVQKISGMLSQGANFGALARQFSKGSAASNGGDLGWVFKSQVSQEEYNALSQMTAGSHRVVRTARGYSILLLRDKREAGLGSFTTIEFRQVVVPFGEAKTPESERDITEYATKLKNDAAGNCYTFLKLAKESDFMGISDTTQAVLESINPAFRKIIGNTPAGGISAPIKTDEGLIFFCVLNKRSEQIKEPTKDDIKNQKIAERLETFSERELQNLKKAGEIELSEKYRELNIL